MSKTSKALAVTHVQSITMAHAPEAIDLLDLPLDETAETTGRAAESVERLSFLGHLHAAAAFAVVFIVLCCGIYPVVIWGIAQAIFPVQANGSLVTKAGTFTTDPEKAVGSALLGQSFAAPEYFHPRPSAAGAGYDAASSGGTNLGPLSAKLLNGIHDAKNEDGTPNPAGNFDGIKDLVAAYRAENGLADDAIVPADAVTRSASGLDPHISPENARLQAGRVARARNLSDDAIRRLIIEHTDAPALGILGEAGVNVLLLNLALDRGAR